MRTKPLNDIVSFFEKDDSVSFSSCEKKQGCLWLLAADEELFVPLKQFPWFDDASIEKSSVVERHTADQLYWPLLGIDLSVESIRNPATFPLVVRSQS